MVEIVNRQIALLKNKLKTKNMKKIKAMVESAPTKKDAMDMLTSMRIYGNLSDLNYEKGRKLIRKEFSNKNLAE